MPKLFNIFVLFVFFVGAASAVPVHAKDEQVTEEAIFYPPPPQMPRLQFLKKFSSALDVETEKQGFRDFVFGGVERERQLIEKPYGIAIFEGALYVVDARGNGWGVFDLASGKARVVRPTGQGALNKPINITIDKDGTRYVTDTQRAQVVVFDRNDAFVRAIGEPGQFRPSDVVISGDRLYVSDVANHQVHVLDKASGETLRTFGKKGGEPGQFLHPTNLALGPDGSLYVTDTNNFRVQRFDADGELMKVYGGGGYAPGFFNRPKGVSVDRDGNMYVVDAAFENVQVFHPDGGALMAFAGPGDDRDSINLPTALKVDYDNVKYFEKFADPGFELEYLVIVASQYGINKVVVYGYITPRE